MSVLFDKDYYLSTNRDVAAAGLDGLEHFLASGAKEKRSPHPLFDLYHYASQFDDIAKILPNPIEHYLNGGFRIADPHPLFDREFYLSNGKALPADVNPLLHFLEFGAGEDRDPHPLFRTAYYRKKAGLDKSTNPLIYFVLNRAKEGEDPHPLFSIAYYLKHNPDVKTKGSNPLIHYLRSQPSEFRRPHPLFDPYFYNEAYAIPPDANLLSHYVKKGAKSLLEPHRLFDSAYYENQNNDVDWSRNNPLEHFQEVGASKGKNPHPLFDTTFYLSNLPDDSEAIDNALTHYIEVGSFEGYDPHPLFHSKYYADRHKYDAKAKGISPLEHYLQYGSAEGRNPNSFFDDAFYAEKHYSHLKSIRNPLLHYVLKGAALGLDSHPRFNTERYLRLFEDEESAKANPLKHFFEWCQKNNLSPTEQQISAFLQEGVQGDRSTSRFHQDYLQHRQERTNPGALSKTVVALYEPQLRAPDTLSAPTYWLDVVRNNNRTRGLPSDLSFYDLRNQSIVKEQATLARKYGIGAFCITLHSDCGEQLVLPLDQFADRESEAPSHCICVSLRGTDNLSSLAKRVAKYIEHPSYLTAEDEKLLFVKIEFSGADFTDISDKLSKFLQSSTKLKTRILPMPSEQVRLSDSPGKYQASLENALHEQAEDSVSTNLIFVDSWNDWLTGTNLEPDMTFGHAFLESTRNALETTQPSQSESAQDATAEKVGRRYFGLPESSVLHLFICDLRDSNFESTLVKTIAAFTDQAKASPHIDSRLVVHLKSTNGNAPRYRAALSILSKLNDLALILDSPLTENELKNLIRNSDYPPGP